MELNGQLNATEALSLGKGPMAPVGQEALWNSRGSVEAMDTRKSAGRCWESNLNTSVPPVAVVRVSGALFMVGNCELASNDMLSLRVGGNLCPCLKASDPLRIHGRESYICVPERKPV